MNSTVLVVDDDEPLRALLCESLVDEGYFAVGAANGQEALTYLRQASGPPCMILLDLMMPVMNGWQFLAAVKGDPSAATIPIVVITAKGSFDRDSLDADEFVLKPISLETLLRAARRFCPC